MLDTWLRAVGFFVTYRKLDIKLKNSNVSYRELGNELRNSYASYRELKHELRNANVSYENLTLNREIPMWVLENQLWEKTMRVSDTWLWIADDQLNLINVLSSVR